MNLYKSNAEFIFLEKKDIIDYARQKLLVILCFCRMYDLQQ